MAVRPILLYPDSRLKGIAQPVSPADPSITGIVQDMLDTLDASPGVALAAPQIGHLLQIIVVDVSRKKGETGHGLVILLNPRILEQEAFQPAEGGKKAGKSPLRRFAMAGVSRYVTAQFC